ncbi:MAG: HIT domain-containing protein [Thermoanaerobaculia bacterium]
MTEVLFTPWRLAYLTSGGAGPKDACLFCVLAQESDADALIVHRARFTYVLLNRYPYSNAHLMITPYAHRAGLFDMTAEERYEVMELGALSEEILRSEYQPHGLNLGLNLGKSAGAGVVGHAHLHVVPRWDGDTNFMMVIGGTRTVPEDLGMTRNRLAPRFRELSQKVPERELA